MQQELDVLTALVDASKLQNERSKNATMMIDEKKGQPSSKVLGDDCWQENISKGFKKRQKLCPISSLMVRG
jgi:hypothetical protein